MYLTGFSLGGNVSLKFLGELGDNAEARGVYGGAVACVPFDPARAQSKLDVGFSRAVYSEVSKDIRGGFWVLARLCLHTLSSTMHLIHLCDYCCTHRAFWRR